MPNRSSCILVSIFSALTIQPAIGQLLTSLRIEGPTEVPEQSTTYYRLIAGFEQGLEFDVTLFAVLSITTSAPATFGPFGDLHAGEVGDEDVQGTIEASFLYGGVSANALLPISIRYAVSQAGSALDFDGENDIVFVPAASSLAYSGTGGWTIEAWVNPRNVRPFLQTPIVGQISLGLAGHDPYALGLGDGEVHFHVEGAFGTIQRVSAPIEAEWTHVAGVYDPFRGTVSIYVNGLERTWQPISVLMDANSGYPVLFGGQGDGPRQFDGRLDEVRIWRTARTYCEIRGYMSRPLAGDEHDLIGYWRADERGGQAVVDSSSYGNHASRGSSAASEPNDPRSVASSADLGLGEFPPIAWTNPQVIPEVSSGQDWDVTVSSDGLEMYISSERQGFAENDIYRTSRVNTSGMFATPVRVTELSILGYERHDSAPTLSANGRRIYFSRQIGHGPADLWVAERSGLNAPWNEPTLITSLNAVGRDERIALSADELHAVFTTERSGAVRFWTASRNSITEPWANLAPIASLTGYTARSCSLTADGLTLFVTAIGPFGLGGYDVWRTTRSSESSPFGPPVHYPNLSTPGHDLGIWVSQDGRNLFLVPNGSGGQGRVYNARYEITGGPQDGELDCDGDIDMDDYEEFSSCLNGPEVMSSNECGPSDYDMDEDVDLADLARFQRLFAPAGQ